MTIAEQGTGLGPVEEALEWITARGIRVEERGTASSATERDGDRAVLHLVEPGDDPPACSELEDWIRRPLDRDELYARADRLLARLAEHRAAQVAVDDENILRVGARLVVLSPLEARLVRTLLDQVGRIVTREALARAIWPDGPPSDPRALDNRVKATRGRLASVPIRIHTVRGRGLLLEVTPPAA